MTRSVRRTICLAACMTMLSGCSMTKEQRDQMLGGLLGAAGGAAIGALASGGDPAAIAAGAAGGALVGWGAVKLTQYYAEKTRTAQEEGQIVGYTEGQGTVIQIRGAKVSPDKVKAGDEITFETEYALLAPTSESTVAVEETWELWKDGKLVTKIPPKAETREPGGWRTQASIDAPTNIEPGTYVVKNRVQAGSSYDERISAFIVG